MKNTIFNPVKNYSLAILLSSAFLLFSCQESTSSTNKKNSDSAYSGLEGTREQASQLSNATIDTSSGKSGKEMAPIDSTVKVKKDSVPN
ncbi:MAG: hypothetical protein ABIN89_08875 [Chitinophagaceae bacterium]